jgi:multiple sugar transport system permease protein
LGLLAYHALAFSAAAIFVVAAFWVLAASLRSPSLPPPRVMEWIPNPVAWTNYLQIFELLPLGRYLANSLLLGALAVPPTIVVASWAGFAMAQMPPRIRYAFLALAVVLRMLPITAFWLTRFLVLKKDPVLLHQVFDDVLLVAVDPTREGHE